MTQPSPDAEAVAADRTRAVETFLHSLSLLNTDSEGLTPGHHLDDLNMAAMLSLVVKGYTAAADTPEDVLLYQLADATESLLVAAVEPATDDVVTAWHTARATYLICRLSGL